MRVSTVHMTTLDNAIVNPYEAEAKQRWGHTESLFIL